MQKLRGIGLTVVIVTISVCLSFVSLLSAAQKSDQGSGKLLKKKSTAIAYEPSLLVQLRVSNLDRAIHFYQDILGLDLVLRNDELRWAKISLGIDDVQIGLGEGEKVLGSGTVSMNIGVIDIEAARKTLEQRGVVFKSETITIPGIVKLADCTDPDGNKIRLAQDLAVSK